MAENYERKTFQKIPSLPDITISGLFGKSKPLLNNESAEDIGKRLSTSYGEVYPRLTTPKSPELIEGGGAFRPRAASSQVSKPVSRPSVTPSPSVLPTNAPVNGLDPKFVSDIQQHKNLVARGSDGHADLGNDLINHYLNAGQSPVQLPTTQENFARQSIEAGKRGDPTAGIIPSWNSPTGQPIDARTGTTTQDALNSEKSITGPQPPQGWVQAAIKAARAGEGSYNTGAPPRTSEDQNLVRGAIAARPPQVFSTPFGGAVVGPPGRTYIQTPSGGSFALPDTGGQVETARRANLYSAIQKSTGAPVYGNYPTSELQTKADEAQARANQQRVGSYSGGGAY